MEKKMENEMETGIIPGRAIRKVQMFRVERFENSAFGDTKALGCIRAAVKTTFFKGPLNSDRGAFCT